MSQNCETAEDQIGKVMYGTAWIGPPTVEEDRLADLIRLEKWEDANGNLVQPYIVYGGLDKNLESAARTAWERRQKRKTQLEGVAQVASVLAQHRESRIDDPFERMKLGEALCKKIEQAREIHRQVMAVPALPATVSTDAATATTVSVGTTQPTVGAETACEEWLTGLMRASPGHRPKPKRDFLDEAKGKFPRLSDNGFERAWGDAVKKVPSCRWNAAGRPKGPRKESPQQNPRTK